VGIDETDGRIAAAVARVQSRTRDALGRLTLADLLAEDYSKSARADK
jgi:hypothetical protein